MRIYRLLCALGLVLFVALSGLSSAHACPACQDQINSSVNTLDVKGGASGGNGLTSIESGYSWSVLFLIAMPFGILSFLAYSIYQESRRIGSRTALPPSSQQKI